MINQKDIADNQAIIARYLSLNSDPDDLDITLGKAPFSSEQGAVDYARQKVKEIDTLLRRIPSRHNEVPFQQILRWYQRIRLIELVNAVARAAAAYAFLAGTIYCMPIKDAPRRKRNAPWHADTERALELLGESGDPGEEIMNEIMIMFERLRLRLSHSAEQFEARVSLLKYKKDRTYTQAMEEAGWSRDEFYAVAHREVGSCTRWP